jgi:hypothetical protein
MYGGVQTLQNMYITNFTLMHEYKYSLTELDNMFPFERDIYLALIQEDTKKKKEAAAMAKQRQEATISKMRKRR